MVLTANKSESVAEFEEEPFEPGHQSGFEFAFGDAFVDVEEVEDVGVTDQLVGQVGVRRREVIVEVGGRRADALVELVADLVRQYSA